MELGVSAIDPQACTEDTKVNIPTCRAAPRSPKVGSWMVAAGGAGGGWRLRGSLLPRQCSAAFRGAHHRRRRECGRDLQGFLPRRRVGSPALVGLVAPFSDVKKHVTSTGILDIISTSLSDTCPRVRGLYPRKLTKLFFAEVSLPHNNYSSKIFFWKKRQQQPQQHTNNNTPRTTTTTTIQSGEAPF